MTPTGFPSSWAIKHTAHSVLLLSYYWTPSVATATLSRYNGPGNHMRVAPSSPTTTHSLQGRKGGGPLAQSTPYAFGNADAMTWSPCALLRLDMPTAGCAIDGRPMYESWHHTNARGKACHGRWKGDYPHTHTRRHRTTLPALTDTFFRPCFMPATCASTHVHAPWPAPSSCTHANEVAWGEQREGWRGVRGGTANSTS